MPDMTAFRWALAMVIALAVIALIAYARGEPGDDDRDPGESTAVELISY
jgi:hypothetical protein